MCFLVTISCCLCPGQVNQPQVNQTYSQPRLGKIVGNRTSVQNLLLRTATRNDNSIYWTHEFSHASSSRVQPGNLECFVQCGISQKVCKNIGSWKLWVEGGKEGNWLSDANGRSQCGEQPHVNWTSVREDDMQSWRGKKGQFFSHRFCVVLAKWRLMELIYWLNSILWVRCPIRSTYYPGYFCSPIHEKPAFLFYTPEVYHGNLENQPLEKDLVTYSTLAEPVMRSRRCFGDTGVWSYCVLVEVMVSVVILLMFQRSQTTTWYV